MGNSELLEIQRELEELRKKQNRLKQKMLKKQNSDGGKAVYNIRPAGRHVLTIGEDLIQDQCAAIIELVKNSYDADSPCVEITLSKDDKERVKIVVRDYGHGMTLDDMVDKWLVPSTKNKLDNRKSPSGRIMQGRKGIGRYAASILGDFFTLKSVTRDGRFSVIELDWNQFKEKEYLDQIGVVVDSGITDEKHGTCITMIANEEQSKFWNEKNIDNIKLELKRLVSPKDMQEEIDFNIFLNFDGFYHDTNLDVREEINPFPILDLFDYRIYGSVATNGEGIMTYECQKVSPEVKENIPFSYDGDTHCGELKFDIRVYDRDGSSIETLIKRGLKDENSGKYVSKNYARKIIDGISGIGVYRNGFRIRPLGDPDYDWLTLNKERVMNPSKKIGSDQVSGVVHIQSEEVSNLEEKSARDGLKDNYAYEELKKITKLVIERLEEKRFLLRRKLGLSKPKEKIEKQLSSLYDYSELKKSTSEILKNVGLNNDTIMKIEDLINEEEKKNNNTVEEIRKAVAMYQGQVTVGKIINIVLHEGRRPLNYITGQLPNLKYYCCKFKKNQDKKSVDKIIEFANGIGENGQTFVKLFAKINPLAAKRRQKRNMFAVRTVINEVVVVFEKLIKEKNISVKIDCDEMINFYGWKDDFYTILTNLIDNSIFWMCEKDSFKKEIFIEVKVENDIFMINYMDSGPGISKELLESEVIFEPEFSTKPEGGSGLGLAISGEAAERNSLVLKAEESDVGAHFVITEKRAECEF